MAIEARDISQEISPELGPNSSSYGEFHINRETGSLVLLDDEEILLPKGCEKLILQPRSCGDYYAEITGAKHVAGFAASRADAVKAAVARVGQ